MQVRTCFEKLRKDFEIDGPLGLQRWLKPFDQAWRATRSAVVDLVLPPVCRLCSAPVASESDFCRSCETQLNMSVPAMRSACRRCGFPGPVRSAGPARSNDNDFGADTDVPCAHCRTLDQRFDAVVALWSYQGRVCDAVVAAKYVHNAPLADALARRLGQRVRASIGIDRPGFPMPNPAVPDLVTAVPSHFTRQLSRGGNALATVGRTVAKTIGISWGSVLFLTRPIAKQAWLDDRDRRENVRDAFSLRKGYASPRPPRIANRHILLVDDVLTTGATANEVAGVLKAAGATRVTLAVVARAVRAG